MKKITSFLLIMLLCLSLSGCKSSEVKDVEAQINKIGQVTLSSKRDISLAKDAYASLTRKEKAKVGNIDVLTAAEAEYVTYLIEGIGKVNRNTEAAIITAENAYQDLSDEAKTLVANHVTLTDARAAYEALFTTVEITLGNWQEYFEFQTEDRWEEDAFRDAIAIEQMWIFRLKEKYADSVDMESLDLAVSFNCELNEKTFDVDFNNRSYSLLEDVSAVYERITGDRYRQDSQSTGEHGTWSYRDSVRFDVSIAPRHLFEHPRFKIEDPEVGYNPWMGITTEGQVEYEINYVYSLDNITIDRIQGSFRAILN